MEDQVLARRPRVPEALEEDLGADASDETRGPDNVPEPEWAPGSR